MKRKEMRTLSTNAKHEWDSSTWFVFTSPALRAVRSQSIEPTRERLAGVKRSAVS
jgi:hypothetical protein